MSKQLHSIKFANSIRVGTGEENFVTVDKFSAGTSVKEINLIGDMFVEIVPYRGEVTNSALLNAIWWKFKKEEPKPKPKPRPKAKAAK